MKKILILLAGIAIALAACTKKEMKDDSAQTERVSWPSVITVATEPVVDSETKSVIADDGAFSWFAGTGETAEKLGIYTNAGFKVYTCTDAATGTFGGDLEGAAPSTVAVYPAGQYVLSTKTLTVTMPASYEYVPTLAKTPMIAQISGSIDNLTFKHIAALLKVSVKNVPPTATQLVLETDENVAGEFVISDCTVADAVITNDDGSDKSVAVNFPAAGAFTDKNFFIPIPAGTYDHFNLFLKDENGNKLAGRQFAGTTIARKNLARGNSAIELPRLELSDAIVLNDTQIGLRWSENAFATTSAAITADKASAYTFGIYSDAACTSKLWDWETAANAAVFTSTPGHVFSGLAPATTYYIKVKDATNGIVAVKAFTTEAAEANFVATSAPAVNDVILNQNFNELLWGGEPVNKLSGVTVNAYGKAFTLPTDKTNNKICDPSTNLNLFKHAGSGEYTDATDYIAGTTLADWKGYISYAPNGQPNPICGGVRFGGNSSTGYLVSPQITGLDAPARVRVTFHASAYAASQSFCVAAFPASVTAYSASTTFYIKTAPVLESDPIAIAQDVWAEYSAEIDVPAGGRIGIGCPYGGEYMRVYLDDIKVEYLGSAPLMQRLEYVNNSQIAVRWSTTGFATPATDIVQAYTFGIFTDAECTSNVYGRTFSVAENKDSDYGAGQAFLAGYCPGFVFSQLAPGTDYWVKITNGGNTSISKYTTTSENNNGVMTTTAAAGDVILFQDFNEITLSSDFIEHLSGVWIGAKGYNNGNYGYPDATNNIIYAQDLGYNTLFNAWNNAAGGSHAGANWLAGTSFKDWKYSGDVLTNGCGYLRLIAGRYAITPAISCLSGTATVKVTVKGAINNAGNTIQVVVYPADIATSDAHGYKVSTAYVADSEKTISANYRSWTEGSCTLTLQPGQRLGFSSNTASQMVWLNEVKVELVSYD